MAAQQGAARCLSVSVPSMTFIEGIHACIVLGRYTGINYGLHLILAYSELCKIPAVSQITSLVPWGGNFMEMTLRQSWAAQQGAFYGRHLSSRSSLPPLGPAQSVVPRPDSGWGWGAAPSASLLPSDSEGPLPWPVTHCPSLGGTTWNRGLYLGRIRSM